MPAGTRDDGVDAAPLVAAASAELAAARAAAVAGLVDDEVARSAPTPTRAHLLPVTGSGLVTVCPACVFDGDLPGGDAAELVAGLDEGVCGDPGWPAGPMALLGSLAAPGFAERLATVDDYFSTWEPQPAWTHPGRGWIWLPPAAQRPWWLAGLGPGAALSALRHTVDTACPQLYRRFRARLAAVENDTAEDDPDPDDPGTGGNDSAVDTSGDAEDLSRWAAQLWPAVLAYRDQLHHPGR